MSFTRYFGKDTTKSFFRKTRSFRLQAFGKSSKMEREWWFKNYTSFTMVSFLIYELNEAMLRKLLKFWTGFNDPASFDEQFTSLDFSSNKVLLRPSACTFNLFLPLKCTGEEEFKEMINMALNVESEVFEDFLWLSWGIFTVNISYLEQTH